MSEPQPQPNLPLWGEIGSLLEGLGAYLENSPVPEGRRYGRYLKAVGSGISNSDQAADTALGGASAAEIAGAIAGAVAGAALPAAFLGTMTGAVGFTLALGAVGIPPALGAVLAIAAAVALAELGATAGAALFGWLEDQLSDLLSDILADPIVLDLDGDGIELNALASSTTFFDMDNDGVAERTGWVSPQDGLLVHDANGNGLADGIGELFGSANVDGYDELAELDLNADGRIDANDAAFADLMVWRDLDSYGVGNGLTRADRGRQ
jgi:hypothetical protein